VRLLAQGELDLALIILPLHTRDPALATTALLREPLVVAAPADGSVLRAKSVRVRDLARFPLVMFREGYDLREVTLDAFRRERIDPRVAVEGGELDAVLSFAEAGLGVAVVPSMVLEGRPGLRRISFVRPGLSRTIAFAHRRDVEAPATAREVPHSVAGPPRRSRPHRRSSARRRAGPRARNANALAGRSPSAT
jgi:DNA-binding transcriptional LysR family regulator